MNRVVHFEIHSDDPEKTAEFYTALFGWEIKEWVFPGVEIKDENRYWVVMTAPKDSKDPGIGGGLIFRRGPRPQPGQPVNAYVCTITVDSLDTYVTKAVELDATVSMPKMPIKGVGWIAYCTDPAGNIFGIMQEDASAA